jgi:hypothetical protein
LKAFSVFLSDKLRIFQRFSQKTTNKLKAFDFLGTCDLLFIDLMSVFEKKFMEGHEIFTNNFTSIFNGMATMWVLINDAIKITLIESTSGDKS